MYRHVSAGKWAYEPDVLATLVCLLGGRGTSRFVNVGANIGYFPLIVKRLLGDRVDVHVFEPMPELLERLGEAAKRNRVDLTISPDALADFVGTAPFHLSARSDTSNSLNPNFRPAKDVIEVRVTTLDSMFPGSLRPVDTTVLLVDTESTEPAVLRGGMEFIRRERPAIVCEVLAGRTEADLSAIIAELGYVAYALTDEGVERRDEVVGDRTYEHRDWLFLPDGAEPPPPTCFRSTMERLAGNAG